MNGSSGFLCLLELGLILLGIRTGVAVFMGRRVIRVSLVILVSVGVVG